MSEAAQCGATVGAYLDPGDRGVAGGKWREHAAENPVRGVKFFGICNDARNAGVPVNFVVEGEHAEEAAGRVRTLLGKPLDVFEVSSKTILWASVGAGENAPKGGYERAELTATLPGEHGFECIFYGHLANRTARLRRAVYVTVVARGEEFRPAGFAEHFPNTELAGYQMAGGVEEAFGKGSALKVRFVCYSPPGSGAAEEAASEIRAGLEKLREVATWPEGKRSWFGLRHGLGAVGTSFADGPEGPYRPPSGVLSHRPEAPAPGPRKGNAPPARLGQFFDEAVSAHLKAWGIGEGEAREVRKMFGGRSARAKAGGAVSERSATKKANEAYGPEPPGFAAPEMDPVSRRERVEAPADLRRRRGQRRLGRDARKYSAGGIDQGYGGGNAWIP